MSYVVNSKKLVFAVLVCGTLIAPFWSEAATITINPAQDTHVDAYDSGANFGDMAGLDVGEHGHVDSPDLRRSYLLFDLSSVPAAAAVNSAILYVNANAHSSNSPSTTVTVHDVSFPVWDEMTVTWDTLPNTPEMFYPFPTDSVAVSGAGAYAWDVTNDVAAAYGVGVNYSAVLRIENELYLPNEPNFVQFDARTAGNAPRLVIDYNPVLETPPWLSGAVISVVCRDDPIYIAYNPFAEPNFILTPDEEEEEDESPLCMLIDFREIYDHDEPDRILALDVNHLPEFGWFDFDRFGRLSACSASPAGADSNRPTEMELGYDFRGNLIDAKTRHSDTGRSSWSLAYDSNDAIFRRVLDRTDIAGITTAQVDYFPHNPAGLLGRLIEGSTGDATSYLYDSLSRLIEINVDGGLPMRRYQYDPEGMLRQYQNFENPDLNCTYGYSYDPNTLPTRIASSTFSPNPAHTRLGQLELSYHSNATLNEVRYSSAESGPTLPLFKTVYAYDNFGRILRIRCISHDPDVPSIVVTMDPDLPEGDFMLSNYFYDDLGRLAWTVDSCGYITRSIYHQVPSLRGRKMLDLHIEEPNRPAITSYEYDDSPAAIRASDLKGRFTKYEYDSVGNRISSCVLGVHGAGGAGGNAQGQVLRMSANDGLGPDSSPRVESDQYGNFSAVLRVIEAPSSGEKDVALAAGKIMTTLGRNKKKLPGKPAREGRRGCSELLKGDCNGDCRVNFLDVACLAEDWLVDKSEEH